MVFMFRQWNDDLNFKRINAYFDESGNHGFFNLSSEYDGKNSLSPNTSILLNSWVNLFNSKKNLIVNFPDNILRPIPLLAYLFSRMTNKSTLIFTSGNTQSKDHITRLHNRHYQLLFYSDIGKYLWEDIPIGVVKKNSIECVPHVIHFRGNFKDEKRENLKDNLISSDNAKILLNSSDNLTKLTKVVNNVWIDEDNFDNIDVKLDIGAVIFENANRFIHSSNMVDNFTKWLYDLIDEDVLLLFHFSRFNNKLITEMKNKTNALVLDFNNAVLKNEILYDSSLNYFNDYSYSNFKILNNYNLDLKDNYDFDYNVSIADPPLFKGNLDMYLGYANQIIHDINVKSIKNKRLFYYILNLLNSLTNLAIDPSFFKVNFLIGRFWRFIDIPTFVKIVKNEIKNENAYNNILLNRLVSYLNNIYYELAYCKHYWEDNNYERKNKNYLLLDIANNQSSYFDDEKQLLIGTFQETEPKILNKFLDDLDNVHAVYLKHLFNRSEDLSDYNLLLPGVINNSKFSSILLQNFNQILVLAYDGFNKNIIQQQINQVLNPSIEDEKSSMDNFKELYKYFGITTNNDFFNSFNERYDKYLAENTIVEEETEETEKKSIKDLFGNYQNYLNNNDDCRKQIDKLTDNFSSNVSYSSHDYETIEVTLKNLNNNKFYVKKLDKNKKYLRFKDYDNLDKSLDVKPDLLKKNDYVIVLDDNKSFLEIYMDIFEEDIDIDKKFIDYWRDILYDYVTRNNLKVKKVYEDFIDFLKDTDSQKISYNTFRLWVNGYAIAPSKKENLMYLAEFLDDKYMLENHELIFDEAVKLRTVNRNMGRKLSYIIKEIIQNTGLIDFDLLSFEERNIYDLIKNSVYQVISVS